MAMALELSPPTNAPNFHTLVCRHQPAWAIAMKIDRSGSLSFAIRGIPSPIRPPIRHSGEGRNPEGKGGTNHTQTPPTTRSHFHTSVCRHQRLVRKLVPASDPGRIPAPAGDTNHRRPKQRQPRVAREKCSAGACPQLRATG